MVNQVSKEAFLGILDMLSHGILLEKQSNGLSGIILYHFSNSLIIHRLMR